MDRLSSLLSFAIILLALSYVLFTVQQYFSAFALVAIFAIALSSAIVLVLCYRHSKSGFLAPSAKTDRLILVFIAAASVLVLMVALYDSAGPAVYGSLPVILLLVFAGIAISIAGLYALGRLTRGMDSRRLIIVAVVASIAIGGATYGAIYGFRSVNWGGIDELSYNYYASYLLVHGTNPYLASMEPILQQRNIFPTVQLNGTFEYAYDYPALSFLPYVFMPLFGIKSFFTFILIVISLTVLMAYFIYYKSGFNRLALIPIGAWILVTYTLVGTTNQYLAVSVLFLMAYVERRRFLVSGIFVGLAASIIQLAWFAIPFLYILVYREHGGKNLLKCVGATLLVFAIVNGYFLLASPKQFIGNNLAIFGTNKLVFFGPNMMQLLVAHYPVSMWYSAFISITMLIALLILFYVYTDTLRPLIAVAPIMIFFLAWRNISIYGIPFIPLIIAIYYVKEDPSVPDLSKDRMPIVYSLVALALVFSVVAFFAHGSYVASDSLHINKVMPILYGQPGPVVNGAQTIVGPYSLGGLRISVENNANYTQPVSFYIVSRSPNGYNYILSSELNMTLGPHSSNNYTLQYRLLLVNNNTRIYVFAFSQYYIASSSYRINLR